MIKLPPTLEVLMKLRDGWYGLVLRVDDLTAEKVLKLGGLFAPGTRIVDPTQVKFTLYQSAGMHGLDLGDRAFMQHLQRMATSIGSGQSYMFAMHRLRVHGGQYLMWHADVSRRVQECHQEAMNVLAPFVTPEQKELAVQRALKTNPGIRKRDLEELVRKYALQWVRWRNVPHVLCAYGQEGLEIPPRTKHEHRGVFTALELTAHGPNGHLNETLVRLPIVPQ